MKEPPSVYGFNTNSLCILYHGMRPDGSSNVKKMQNRLNKEINGADGALYIDADRWKWYIEHVHRLVQPLNAFGNCIKAILAAFRKAVLFDEA